MWRIRLAGRLPRYALQAASIVGLLASARFALAPPRPLSVAARPAATASERPQEGYAVLFARRYLTWEASQPQASARALEPFLGPGMEADAGLQLPPGGAQTVEWAETVQAREAAPGEHVYTVAAQTSSDGLVYLTVGVTRTPAGGLALTGYPAFVGAPASDPVATGARLREVTNASLATVVQRALRNYLDGASDELAADLSSGAQVSPPTQPLTLVSLQRLDWAAAGSAVVATVQARDARGVQYTLAYELNVVSEQGRWEISAVQMDPDA